MLLKRVCQPLTHSLCSFPHNLLKPIVFAMIAVITFPISSQVPLAHYFSLMHRKLLKSTEENQATFSSAEFAMANLFTAFL